MRNRAEYATVTRWRRLPAFGFAVLLGVVLGSPALSVAANPVTTSAASSRIVQYAPGTTVQSLAGRPDTDIVEFSNGSRVSLGAVRRLRAARLQSRPLVADHFRTVFAVKPGVAQLKLGTGADLSAALRHPDSETIALPSGVRLTVGQLRFLQPLVEQRLGRSLASLPQRPNLSGPATRVDKGTSKERWQSILQQPDSTVLESPNGTRLTVGELKQGMRQRQTKPAQGSATAPSRTPNLPAASGRR